MKNINFTAIVFLTAAVALSVAASVSFYRQRQPEPLYPSAALTQTLKLSHYDPSVAGTNADTDVYLFDSGVPGGTMVLLGGTHPNEPAGFLAAVTILENLSVTQGRVIIIPRANQSGFSHTDPLEAFPGFYTIAAKHGPRQFRIGSRLSNPLDQWPDPIVYLQYPSGQSLSGFEARNLNRAYPGKAGGNYTERLGFAIVQLLKKEKADIAFDLHEAAPEIPIINAIVYHEKCEEMALNAVLSLEFLNLRYAPEKSPKNFRGLSHREWGDYTDVNPFLMETCNPIQGRLRGTTDTALITKGVSEFYRRAKASGKLRIEYDETGEPLWRRVGRHIEGFKALLESYNQYKPGRPVAVAGIPAIDALQANGVGAFIY